MTCMQSFQALIPEELRTTIIPTSWSDVETAVSTVQKHWELQSQEKMTSQAKEWFRKMCNGLHSHKALLDLLPKESEYVSVIAGAVTMIIKVSLITMHIHRSNIIKYIELKGLGELYQNFRVICEWDHCNQRRGGLSTRKPGVQYTTATRALYASVYGSLWLSHKVHDMV